MFSTHHVKRRRLQSWPAASRRATSRSFAHLDGSARTLSGGRPRCFLFALGTSVMHGTGRRTFGTGPLQIHTCLPGNNVWRGAFVCAQLVGIAFRGLAQQTCSFGCGGGSIFLFPIQTNALQELFCLIKGWSSDFRKLGFWANYGDTLG